LSFAWRRSTWSYAVSDGFMVTEQACVAAGDAQSTVQLVSAIDGICSRDGLAAERRVFQLKAASQEHVGGS
jgi:hypothetical protein